VKLAVYQIGLGSFGRYGFEKFLEMHNHFEEVDIEFKGLCDTDFDKREKAERFAESQGVNIEIYDKVENLYSDASQLDQNILIYDAGPTDTHASNIYRSMSHGFYHLAEKPPSMKRQQHLKEKQLAEKNSVMWKVDFVERENPVVKKTRELLKGKELERIKVFRESSVGIEKLINPAERHGIKGGDILDKMIHEAYILDFLESAEKDTNIELKEANTKYFMPWKPGSQKMLGLNGGYTEEISYNTATAQTQAVLVSEDAEINLNSSWLGLSKECRIEAKKAEEELGVKVVDSEYSETKDTAFINEEARFFIVEGETCLLGDMLHKKLYDLDKGETIELDYYLHDQLYRVIRKAVLDASKNKDSKTSLSKDTDIFMNTIFDIKENIIEGDYLEELDSSLERFKSLVVEDGKVLETEEPELILS